MPNNDLTPDKDGQIGIPFCAYATAYVAWTPDLTNDEIYDEAHEQIREQNPDWEIDDETLSTWQGEPSVSDLDLLIQDLEKRLDFSIIELESDPPQYQWSYRNCVSVRNFLTRWECLSHFILNQAQDLDELLGINGDED